MVMFDERTCDASCSSSKDDDVLGHATNRGPWVTADEYLIQGNLPNKLKSIQKLVVILTRIL